MTIGAVIEYLAMKENFDDTSLKRVVVVSCDKQVKESKVGLRLYLGMNVSDLNITRVYIVGLVETTMTDNLLRGSEEIRERYFTL